jgi:hypothetical protein
MKKLTAFFLIAGVLSANAQSVVPPNIRAINTIERLNDFDGMTNGDIMYGIPLPPGKVIGDSYLDTHWKKSTILLYEKDKLIQGFPSRYDIYLDELEINARNGIKVLKGDKIKSFVWFDSSTNVPSYFVNAKDFKNEDNVPLTGFFQVLSDGANPLLKKTDIHIRKATYNVALNVGSQDDKILKKDDFYLLKGSNVFEIPSSRKKLLPLFGDRAEVMEKFIKENSLSTTKEDDLKIIFNQYNSLVNN